jgi:hypothetical protein
MNEHEMEEMKNLLKEALPPMRDAQPGGDLWPATRER